jgi:hypothetical protein
MFMRACSSVAMLRASTVCSMRPQGAAASTRLAALVLRASQAPTDKHGALFPHLSESVTPDATLDTQLSHVCITPAVPFRERFYGVTRSVRMVVFEGSDGHIGLPWSSADGRELIPRRPAPSMGLPPFPDGELEGSPRLPANTTILRSEELLALARR